MQVLIENGYVSSYAMTGTLDGGIEVDAPDDGGRFESHYAAYRLIDGALEYDEEKDTQLEADAYRDALRRRREAECFPFINRGQLWYDRLTAEQKNELQSWYIEWLDVTDTLTVPEIPSWLY